MDRNIKIEKVHLFCKYLLFHLSFQRFRGKVSAPLTFFIVLPYMYIDCIDWFDVKIGLKQGCILSPLLFNIFINDLAQTLNNLECGASYGEGDVSILLYADDIILLSDNEATLQRMLSCLNDYCLSWGLTINFEK